MLLEESSYSLSNHALQGENYPDCLRNGPLFPSFGPSLQASQTQSPAAMHAFKRGPSAILAHVCHVCLRAGKIFSVFPIC